MSLAFEYYLKLNHQSVYVCGRKWMLRCGLCMLRFVCVCVSVGGHTWNGRI